jgi:hypothetical protein
MAPLNHLAVVAAQSFDVAQLRITAAPTQLAEADMTA